MTVAFDVDGVLADIHTPWIALYNKDYDDDFTVEQITQWNFDTLVKKECGKDIYKYLTPSLYHRTDKIEFALQAVAHARKKGRVIYATTPTEATLGVKFEWLKRNGFAPTIKDYWEGGDKSLLNADYLVDDYDGNFVDFKGYGVILDRPWNRGLTIGGLHRIHSLAEIENVI